MPPELDLSLYCKINSESSLSFVTRAHGVMVACETSKGNLFFWIVVRIPPREIENFFSSFCYGDFLYDQIGAHGPRIHTRTDFFYQFLKKFRPLSSPSFNKIFRLLFFSNFFIK